MRTKKVHKLRALIFSEAGEGQSCKSLANELRANQWRSKTYAQFARCLTQVKDGDYQLIAWISNEDQLPKLAQRLRELNNQRSDLACVVISSNPNVVEAREALKGKAYDYLSLNMGDGQEIKDFLIGLIEDKGFVQSPEEQLHQHIAKFLQQARKERGLTLSDLAKRSHVSRSMISQIENQLCQPSLLCLWKLSQALGVSMSELFYDF